MTYRPRHRRSAERGLRAAERARNAGHSAMIAALADIDTRFDGASRINRFKMRVESALRRGPDNESIRSWYASFVSVLRRANVHSINRAIQLVVAESIRTETIEQHLRLPRLLIRRETLDEITLILRWIRRYQPDVDVRALIDAMARPPEHRPVVHLMAAE